jgi:hypothetical protein
MEYTVDYYFGGLCCLYDAIDDDVRIAGLRYHHLTSSGEVAGPSYIRKVGELVDCFDDSVLYLLGGPVALLTQIFPDGIKVLVCGSSPDNLGALAHD